MMIPSRGAVRSLVLLALLAAGGVPREARAQDGREVSAPPASPIVSVRADDAEMNAAIARARATVGELVARLRHPRPAQSYLGVKVRLGNERVGEHVWLYDVHLEGERIVGRLVDDALHFPDYRRGHVMRVPLSEISDWMTVEEGRACGGFTARVLLPRWTATERKNYLRAMSLRRLPPGDRLCDGDGEA